MIFILINAYAKHFWSKIPMKGKRIMKFKNKSSSKVIKFLNGKAFYAVLCVCLIAIGVAAWSGIEGYKRLNESIGSESNSLTGKVESGSDVLTSIPSITSKPDTSGTVSMPQNDEADTQSDHESEIPTNSEAQQTAAPVAAYFVSPVLGEVVKGFSDTELQYSVTMDDMRLHKALDIAADLGTPVVAAGEGVVKSIFKDAMLGTVVEIDHGNGITVRYCGLNSLPVVKVGDFVDSSTRLGSIDVIPIESVEQRHLHLEFYKDGKAVSPSDYIAQ